MHHVLSVCFALVAVAHSTIAAPYILSDNFVGVDFLAAFVHEAIPDPTLGRV